jgi:hypothetical protein
VRLYAGQVRVNREPGEYSVTNDDYDRLLFGYVISRVLLGLPHPYPTKPEHSPGQTAVEKWSNVGKMWG